MTVRHAPVVLGSILVVGAVLAYFGGRAMLTRHDPYESAKPKVSHAKAIEALRSIEPKTLAAKEAFVFKLGGEIARQFPGKNFCVSPLGLDLALAMLCNGAQGDSFEACTRPLGLNDPNTERMNLANSSILDVLNSLDGSPVKVASSVWSVVPMKFNKDYTEDMARYYGADVRKLGSARENALVQVNDWVKDRSKGQIQKVLDRIDSDAKILVFSVVTLSSDWSQPFESTGPMSFSTPSGNVQTPMMRAGRIKGEHCSFGDVQALALPYQQPELKFWIVWGKAAIPPAISQKFWGQMQSSNELTDIDLTMPRFTLETETDLQQAVSAMGGSQLFNAGNDFTFMSHDGGREVVVSKLLQKTRIEVNEKGTRASSATEVEATKSDGEPKSIKLVVDKPFTFLVTDKETRTVLFYGAVVDPTKL